MSGSPQGLAPPKAINTLNRQIHPSVASNAKRPPQNDTNQNSIFGFGMVRACRQIWGDIAIGAATRTRPIDARNFA